MAEIRVVIQRPLIGGGGGVDSVTGDGVGGTSTNVVMSFPNTSEIQAIRPIKTVNSQSLEGVGNIDTPDTTYTDAEIKTKYEANANTNVFTDGDKNKLNGIATGAEVNTINSKTTGEPTGSDLVLNVVSLTQAEYDAGTPIATTLYLITDA